MASLIKHIDHSYRVGRPHRHLTLSFSQLVREQNSINSAISLAPEAGAISHPDRHSGQNPFVLIHFREPISGNRQSRPFYTSIND